MDFLDHLTQYHRGERLGSIGIGIGGLVFLLLALVIWRTATPGTIARGMLLPIAVLGVLGIVLGSFFLGRNNERLDRYPKEYAADGRAFMAEEGERIAAVHRTWPTVLIAWTVLVVAGLCLAFLGSPTWKGVGLGLLLIGTAGHVADGLARERSRTYLERIDAAIVALTP